MKNAWMFGFGILILLGVGLFFVLGKSGGSIGNVVDVPAQQQAGEIQHVVVGMQNLNYYPNTITVKAGKPVSITLDSSVTGCLRSFHIRDLGVSAVARTPDQTIDFTPMKKGTFMFACSMGMGRGTLIVE